MSEEKNTVEEPQESTTVEQVEVNIDEIFGQPGADSVMLPEEEKKKKKIQFFLERKN